MQRFDSGIQRGHSFWLVRFYIKQTMRLVPVRTGYLQHIYAKVQQWVLNIGADAAYASSLNSVPSTCRHSLIFTQLSSGISQNWKLS
jgi:hypothetical protein